MQLRLKIYVYFCSVLLSSSIALATESDSYTFRDIPLKDSSAIVSSYINKKILETVYFTNYTLNTQTQKAERTDQKLEHWFHSSWLDLSEPYRDLPLLSFVSAKSIVDHFKRYVLNELEMCLTGFHDKAEEHCQPYDKIEKIVILPGESIFDEADYNAVTQTYLTPIINLCGVRVGADKITHFLDDAVRFYNLWANEAYSLGELRHLAFQEEIATLGLAYTNVLSFADVEVNMQGVQFFRDIFEGPNPILAAGQERLLIVRRKVDICDYVSSKWDETYPGYTNIYRNEKQEKLRQVIEARKKNPNPFNLSAQEVLARPPREEHLSFKTIWSSTEAGLQTFFLEMSIQTAFPIFKITLGGGTRASKNRKNKIQIQEYPVSEKEFMATTEGESR